MKDKKTTLLIAIIVLLLIGLSYAKSKAPQPVDWTPSFINTKTAPYGTHITYQSLKEIFNKDSIRSTRVPVYNNLKKLNDDYFDENMEYDLLDNNIEDVKIIDNDNLINPTSYVFINTQFSLDDLDLEYLLHFVESGNNAFISTEIFDIKLMDTLNIQSNIEYQEKDTTYSLVYYPQREYKIGNLYGLTTLKADSCLFPTEVLATNNKKQTIFLDVQYGKGHIYLHTVPTTFTNLYMLQTRKYDFGFRCLSYLPENGKIIWDEYQKQGFSDNNSSVFRVMLSNEPLRTALYIIFCGLLLFTIFRAKRMQRIIPVIKPPINSSLEFLGTISNLYYRKNDFSTIVKKRQAYFLDFIRKNYYMTTENIDNEFINILSAKSNTEKGKLEELFSSYKDLILLPYASNEIFLKYNSLLEDFYKNVKNK